MALMVKKIRTTLVLAICLAVAACTENLTTNRPYILTTATTGGTYYPVGVALATITGIAKTSVTQKRRRKTSAWPSWPCEPCRPPAPSLRGADRMVPLIRPLPSPDPGRGASDRRAKKTGRTPKDPAGGETPKLGSA